ncbi:MAG TPA: zinc-binding dehydrogenase, partial [Acidimicrobiales bacterium]|nr:zinc-binding dehydrogenase [Acidimicrobiales bacterium]
LWPTIAASWQKAVVTGTAKPSADHLRALIELAERGVLKPVVDSILPFARIADAHRRVDGGHKVGSLVLTFD